MLLFEIGEKAADDLALQVLLRSAKIARQDRKPLLGRVRSDVVLRAVDERADDGVRAVVGDELRGHRLELSRKEEIQEEGDDDVVAVVAERDLGAAELGGEPVEDPAAKARAERTVRF